MRTGTRLCVDVGTVRIGVARSDPRGVLATPVETIVRDVEGSEDIERIAVLAREMDAIEMIVGLPQSLSGGETASTRDARAFAARLVLCLNIPVRLVDERLSTVSAHSALRNVGRSSRNSRSVVDQLAAVIVLQHALESERGSGTPPGERVTHEQKDVNRGG